MSSIFDSLGMDPGIIIILLLILTIVLAVNVFSSKMRISRLERKYKVFMKGSDAQSNTIWKPCSVNMALRSMMHLMTLEVN